MRLLDQQSTEISAETWYKALWHLLGVPYLQAFETAETVKSVVGEPVTNVGDVQSGELSEELQVIKCTLIEYVIAVHNLQAGQA